jgi:hypothetical protein
MRRVRRLRRLRAFNLLARNRDGATAISVAAALPVLLVLGMATVEFSLVMLDYHRAGEATRRGARLAAIMPPIANLAALEASGTVRCSVVDSLPACDGGVVIAPDTFDAMLTEMSAALPAINGASVEVIYSPSGLGNAETPGGILPLVEVRLVGVRHDYAVLGRLVPGLGGGLDMPSFSTSMIGSGLGVF